MGENLLSTPGLARAQRDLADENVRVHSFRSSAVVTDAVRTNEMNDESLSWNDVQLPGQFAV